MAAVTPPTRRSTAHLGCRRQRSLGRVRLEQHPTELVDQCQFLLGQLGQVGPGRQEATVALYRAAHVFFVGQGHVYLPHLPIL